MSDYHQFILSTFGQLAEKERSLAVFELAFKQYLTIILLDEQNVSKSKIITNVPAFQTTNPQTITLKPLLLQLIPQRLGIESSLLSYFSKSKRKFEYLGSIDCIDDYSEINFKDLVNYESKAALVLTINKLDLEPVKVPSDRRLEIALRTIPSHPKIEVQEAKTNYFNMSLGQAKSVH